MIEKTIDFGVVRYDADGTLDATFGRGGMVTTDFGFFVEPGPRREALQSDGKIVAAGVAFLRSGDTFTAVARYDTGGTLDPSFAGTGKTTIQRCPARARARRRRRASSGGLSCWLARRALGFSGAFQLADFAVARL